MRFSSAAPFLLAFALAALASSAACSGNGVTIPPKSDPPPGVTFSEGTFGGPCAGDIFYTTDGEGYAFCDDGKWAYTTVDPAADGYTDPDEPSYTGSQTTIGGGGQ
jgi:hypothetical protein